MRKKISLFLLVCGAGALFFIHCSSSSLGDQLQFGIHAAQKDLWDEAIFRWKKVIQSNPESASAHNNLAVAYEKKGWRDKAEEQYKKALSLDPNNSYIQSNYEKFKERPRSGEKENEKN
ncbi:tetratricopeptide repeat protein [bacterium]|nr:tetratricopeptide repeat protein [bacterium]